MLADLEPYFARMISTFENTTRKPMGGSLSAIVVSWTNSIGDVTEDETSEFRMGSFVVELLCLIPLQYVCNLISRKSGPNITLIYKSRAHTGEQIHSAQGWHLGSRLRTFFAGCRRPWDH